jgi:hypothetical protein
MRRGASSASAPASRTECRRRRSPVESRRSSVNSNAIVVRCGACRSEVAWSSATSFTTRAGQAPSLAIPETPGSGGDDHAAVCRPVRARRLLTRRRTP